MLPLIKFIIHAGPYRYCGLFACSFDAAMDAYERFPGLLSVSVKAI